MPDAFTLIHPEGRAQVKAATDAGGVRLAA